MSTVLRQMPAESVHCYKIDPVTWSDSWRGHLGMEPTVNEYIDHLVTVFAELRRVLRTDLAFPQCLAKAQQDTVWRGRQKL